MSVMLEIAIGLAFVYLLVASLTSTINEVISTWLDRRAKYLEDAIRRLLSAPAQPPKPAATVADHLLGHGLVKALVATRLSPRPSYIPARTFALALFDVLAPDTDQNRFAAIATRVDSLPDGLKRPLKALLDDAQGDLDKARERVEKWFDAAMERVSGVYKRWTQVALFVIALIVAAILNIDSIRVANRLFSDPAVRAAVVEAARDHVRRNPPPSPGPLPDPGTPPSQDAADKAALEAIKNQANTMAQTLSDLDLPIGWPEKRDGQKAYWPLKLAGLLLTALAASFGAPFWFDALNKLVNVRLTGQKPPSTAER